MREIVDARYGACHHPFIVAELGGPAWSWRPRAEIRVRCLLDTRGAIPGSAGCIDLTDQMDEFTNLMQVLGSDEIEVQVDYGWDGPPNHRHR